MFKVMIRLVQLIVVRTFLVIIPLVTQAHVILINPEGGEQFFPESEMLIQWEESQDHGANNWDIYYSLNDGVDWIELVLDLSEETTEYTWNIPKFESENAKIKIVQDNESDSNYEDISDSIYISNTEPDTDPDIITSFEPGDYDPESELELTNFPNPFSGATVLQINLVSASRVSISILNVQGQIIFSLRDKMKPAGKHQFIWKSDDATEGLYLCRLQTADKEVFRKMVIRR